ncbi:MAG: hypothetical protein AAF456_01880 [Planctomycetota bacterium]
MAVFNESTQRLEFVVARRLEKESFRESVIREVAWQLELDRSRDFLVANMAQCNIDLKGDIPGIGREAWVQAAFYNVEMYRSRIAAALSEDPANAWLSSHEICDGVSESGCALDPLVHDLILRSKVIEPRD